MTLSLTPFLLLLIAIACTSKQSKEQQYPSKGSMLVFDLALGKYLVSAADKKLIATWESFREAISNSDYETLQNLSFDSIICPNCVPLDGNPLMAAITFYNQHASNLFSKSFSSLLFDSSNVRCSYDLDSSYFYAYPVLNTISDIAQPRLVQIFIPLPNFNSDHEGTTGVLGFLETKKGYRFFGYSTIP